MSGEVFFWLFVSVIALVFAFVAILYRQREPCNFKIYAPYLTCWRGTLSQDRPYTQKIYKIFLQLDIANVSASRCTIRNLELIVITKGEKHGFPLVDNGRKIKPFDIKSRSMMQKNLQLPADEVDKLPLCFANENFEFYLSFREDRKKARTARIQKINYILSTSEKA